MKEVRRALMTGLRAPVSRWRLVLVLWLGRLLPALLFFGLPVFAAANARLAHHPDAGKLLDPGADASGFAYAWYSDSFRGALADSGDRLFWLILFGWLFVTFLGGGIVARLVNGPSESFLSECGRYMGRFLRLAAVVVCGAYAVDVGVNAVLAESHTEGARVHELQAFAWNKTWIRGALFLTVLQILGAIHSYARIDIVAFERRSATIAFLRGLATLILRLPKLFLLEAGMLVLAGVAALVAWVLLGAAFPLSAGATWLSVGFFVFLAALGSYLRTGVELGTLEARCRLLLPLTEAPAAAPEPSPIETAPPAEEP